jgi:hypothetical protein
MFQAWLSRAGDDGGVILAGALIEEPSIEDVKECKRADSAAT